MPSDFHRIKLRKGEKERADALMVAFSLKFSEIRKMSACYPLMHSERVKDIKKQKYGRQCPNETECSCFIQ